VLEVRTPAVLEEDLARVLAAEADLVEPPPAAEAGRRRLDEDKLIPAWGGLACGSVLAATMKRSPSCPCGMNVFEPFST